MLKRDILLIVFTAAISSSLTYLVIERSTATTPAKPASHVTGGISKTKDIRSSNPDNKPIHSRINTPTKPDSPQIQTEDSADKESITQEAALYIQKQKELEAEFATFFAKQNGMKSGELNAKIETRFYQEEWNQEWANDRESNIHGLFETDVNLSDISPLQVACRSKSCQVILGASSQAQVRLLSEKFMQASANSDIGMQDKVVAFFPDISAGRLVFYLSENGNMDLFQ